ncbi:NAD(P)-dependent oxidoreductase [Haloferax sp. ATB1]|uniref:NAD(P)-dependent oxidoreductase n=1 Tax=Haloferax sp. ATB1 TaxID=1508454 RepID=UPI0005B22798|nr:NAD(P)-binding domain-containing protein [Haloferax sp. ATB1]
MPQTIGFVGVGIMGKPMAENVLDAGFDVVVHNRSREAVDSLAELGATAASAPSAVASQADVVVTVLPDTEAVEEVVYGDDGLADGFDSGDVLIDMSTISPVATERLSEELEAGGVSMLDAPVSGGEEGARDGSLSIMVGGSRETFDAHASLFAAMGSTVTYCGDAGAGQITKACNQIVVGCTLQAVSEALVLAQRAGADLEAVVDAISGGAAGCWALRERAPRVIRGNFDPGFFASYQYKDLRIATAAGEEYGSPMPATSVVHEAYKAMETSGYGRDDHSAVIKILEDTVGEAARIE